MVPDLDDLPPLRDVIATAGLRAEKALGQNFLLDSNITDKIARQCGDLSAVNVIEIGPGPGGLTRSLLKAGAKSVTAIEFDPRAVSALQTLKKAANGRLEIVQADALETDLTALVPAPRLIAANLPYNIATPLLIGWLRQIREDHGAYNAMVLMFQKEVAQRITAPQGMKAYGRLAILSNWLCETKKLFDLPPSAFTPPPKVASSVVRLVPKAPEPNAPSFESIEKLTEAAFGQRRKMIRSSLKNYAAALEALAIDPSKRAEELRIEEYIGIAARHAG
ncbi:MAG: 16S rRNA (adenine(1518)-N(6)/adenine(1519)-N(6))-dimethyltransferase RsmA [Alphaproteobacteria bacterium]|nr:16S rRNA (adenine(1518)-N(6)/adenine(1519)-N(6))-dimethyltransferase RsmA [Alphaproteobacteria bacterium]